MTTPATPEKQSGKRKVLLIDEHRVLQEGLRKFIDSQPDLVVCGVAESVPQAEAEVEVARPDLVIIDISLKGKVSFALITEIKSRCPAIPILVFSMQSESVYSVAARQAGAAGFVVKTEPPEKLLAEIHRVLT